MKTAEEMLSEHSENYGAIENNPRAIVKASEAINAIKEYAKQQAIGFINWRNNVKKFDKSIIRNNPNITTEQLYEEYLKTL